MIYIISYCDRRYNTMSRCINSIILQTKSNIEYYYYDKDIIQCN